MHRRINTFIMIELELVTVPHHPPMLIISASVPANQLSLIIFNSINALDSGRLLFLMRRISYHVTCHVDLRTARRARLHSVKIHHRYVDNRTWLKGYTIRILSAESLNGRGMYMYP